MKQKITILTILLFVLSFTLSYGQTIVGQWDFDDSGDLTKATVGTALQSFGSPTAVAGINSSDGAVLVSNGDYYKAPVAIGASGTGSLINTYTLVMDIKVDLQDGYNSLMQTDLTNSGDGDYFITGSKNIGCPGAGYSSNNGFREKAWVRTVLVVEEISATEVSVNIYLDGKLVMDGSQSAVDSRQALDTYVLLFVDNDGEEKPTDVTKIVLYDGAMSDEQVATLGNVGNMIVGQWDFDDPNNLGKATIGTDLTLYGTVTSSTGPAAGNGAALLENGDYFSAVVPITPNGAGTLVNTYTLLMDIKIDAFSATYACLLQTKVDNSNDGDLFALSNGKMGNGDIGYSGDIFSVATWYRMVFVVEETSPTAVTSKIYLNGNLKYTGNEMGIDSRISLDDHVLLFRDNDGEEMPTDVSQVVLYNYALTDADVSALGNANDPLPVELTSFTASTSSATGSVVLNWETATEVNNYGFNVERKTEIGDWNEVGFVEGHGNSNSPKHYSFIDNQINNSKYYYRLKQIDIDGTFEYSDAIEVNFDTPAKYELSQNFPNPFNPTTAIQFSVPEAGLVKLTVYNVIGEKVAELVNKNMEAGYHSVQFDAGKLNTGIYIYKLEAGNFTLIRKMILLK